MGKTRSLKPALIAQRIHLIRGYRVMLDEDLADLYGLPTGALNQAVDRNAARFPPDFAFRVTKAELDALKSQIVISNPGRGGRRRSSPRAFTEHGVAMLSSVLRTRQAVAANIQIVRTFVRLRQIQGEYAELARLLTDMGSTYDARFRYVFNALDRLMTPPDRPPREIGFGR